MNSLLFCLLLNMNFNAQKDSICIEKFYQAALEDTSNRCPFIKIKAKDSNNVVKEYILTNKSLYLFFNRNSGMGYKEYIEFMREAYAKKRIFEYKELRNFKGSMEVIYALILGYCLHS